jgi:hypothetical protein
MVAPACPFCHRESPSLVENFKQCDLVLVGAFTNARIAQGTCDLVVERVLKPHDVLRSTREKTADGKKVITLSRPIQAKGPHIIFCELFRDSIDPSRLLELLPGSKLIPYLTGALALKDRPQSERLRYCFDHLASADSEVAMDVYREFARADYKDYMEMAAKLPPDTIAGWLRDPKTPSYRYGLYASLLGHCGKVEHAKVLLSMIENSEKRKGSGIDGMLAGYVMIQPKEGWTYLTNVLKNGTEDFLMRYAALRTIRFFWDYRGDLVARDQLAAGLTLVLGHSDMADFAIEDLRRWQRWETTDCVLDLFDRKSHDVRAVKRAILRFALCCPRPRAASFVDAQRRRNAAWVKETEELLKLEMPK